MRIARDLAGFSLAKADEMRRAMGKKDLAKMTAMREYFIKGCVANDISDKIASDIYDRLAKFASYGFNKSHSLAYSVISYQTAYLKANYTAEFLAANMTHEMNSTDYIVQLIDEGKKFGIETLPPDVNSSMLTFTPTDEGIRFGFAGIKNVGEKAAESIVAERTKNGPFRTLFDFTRRVDSRLVNKRAVEALALSGAFDSTKTAGSTLNQYRSDVFNSIERALDFSKSAAKEGGLFGDTDSLAASEPK
jgi:DNA polymerase-3 subunit alpha